MRSNTKPPRLYTHTTFRQRVDDTKRFEPEAMDILRSLGMRFVKVRLGTDHEDMRKQTDFVIESHVGATAWRLRTYRKDWDATIRTRAEGGKECERDKMLRLQDDHAKYYLTCWKNLNGTGIGKWMFWLIRPMVEAGYLDDLSQEWDNGDGSAYIVVHWNKLVACGAMICTSEGEQRKIFE
jgi:hypothetical protein